MSSGTRAIVVTRTSTKTRDDVSVFDFAAPPRWVFQLTGWRPHTPTHIHVYNIPLDKSFRVHFAVETSRTGSQRLLLHIYTFSGRHSIVLDVNSVQRRRWVMDCNIFILYIRRYKYLSAADRFARSSIIRSWHRAWSSDQSKRKHIMVIIITWSITIRSAKVDYHIVSIYYL